MKKCLNAEEAPLLFCEKKNNAAYNKMSPKANASGDIFLRIFGCKQLLHHIVAVDIVDIIIA